MARLLVDMNLSTKWIPLLRNAGHDNFAREYELAKGMAG